MTDRPIKVIKKADQPKPQSDPEYKIQRHAAGLIKAFALSDSEIQKSFLEWACRPKKPTLAEIEADSAHTKLQSILNQLQETVDDLAKKLANSRPGDVVKND